MTELLLHVKIDGAKMGRHKQVLLTPDFQWQSQRERSNSYFHPLSSLVSTMRQRLFSHTEWSSGPTPSKVRGPKKGIDRVVVCALMYERAGGRCQSPSQCPLAGCRCVCVRPNCEKQTPWRPNILWYDLCLPGQLWNYTGFARERNWEICHWHPVVSKWDQVPIESEIICEWVDHAHLHWRKEMCKNKGTCVKWPCINVGKVIWLKSGFAGK